MLRAAIAISLVAACGTSEPPIDDKIAPSLTLTTPTRGSHTEGDVIEVSGTAFDGESGIDSVTVNGVAATLADDGTFTATVPLAEGVNILETTATDAGGNQVVDHRGILSGLLAPAGTTVRDALVADLTGETFAVIGEGAAVAIEGIDFAAVGDSVSPIVDRGNSCFGVEVDLRDVNFSDLAVALDPVAGGVDIILTATDLDVDMRANWELSCFGGGAGVNISADELTITGTLRLALVSGRFVATLDDATASFAGFDLDVGSIPDSIVNLFVNDIDQKVAGALIGVINSTIPDVLESALDGFRRSDIETEILGVDLTLALTPTTVDITDDGARVALDFAAAAPSLEGATVISTPQPAPETGAMNESLGVAVADDVANHMLALLWQGGGLSLDVEAAGTVLGEVFPGAARVSVELPQPPHITTSVDAAARVGIADLLITASDESGATLAQIAISGHVSLEVTLDELGNARFGADIASIATTVISGEDALGLRPDQIEVFAEVGVSQLRSQLNKVLDLLTIPQFGAEIRSPTLGATRGYLLVSGKLSVK